MKKKLTIVACLVCLLFTLPLTADLNQNDQGITITTPIMIVPITDDSTQNEQSIFKGKVTEIFAPSAKAKGPSMHMYTVYLQDDKDPTHRSGFLVRPEDQDILQLLDQTMKKNEKVDVTLGQIYVGTDGFYNFFMTTITSARTAE